VLVPFAFLKPLFDRLEDSEVTQRLAHLQPTVIGKDLNQRRELATMYAIARHMTYTQRRALLGADRTVAFMMVQLPQDRGMVQRPPLHTGTLGHLGAISRHPCQVRSLCLCSNSLSMLTH